MDEKKKQAIEEIAKVLIVKCGECHTCKYLDELHCADLLSAEELYNAGYRKESDTAREIFDKMLGYIGSQQQFCIVDEEHKTLIDCDKLFNFVSNLAKEKYGVDLGE